MEKTADTLYSSDKRELTDYFWGIVPKTIGEAIRVSETRKLPSINKNNIDSLANILQRYHAKLGILTDRVEENLSRLGNGVVLTGQQPAPFGGKGLIGNKIALTCKLAQLSHSISNSPLIPVFYVADYDGIQPEITRVHYPNPSSSKSVSVSIATDELEGRAASGLQLPGNKWLKARIDDLFASYSEFFASTNPSVRRLLNTRLECLLALVSTTYLSSSTLTDWFVKIWGTIANITNDFGLIFLPMSEPEVRDIVSQGKGYERLLKVREPFIDNFNIASEKLRQCGVTPGVGDRSKDYVPFYLECDNEKYRVKLSYNQGLISGTCPVCKVNYDISINENDPNLDQIKRNISPRVDTSQILVQYILPIKIRVSGPGETSYFAQVYPAATASKIGLPVFLKYTRMFYNAPWIEQLGKKLSAETHQTLHSKDFYKTLGKWAKTKRKGDIAQLLQESTTLTNFIDSVYKTLQPLNEKDVLRYKAWQFGVFGTRTFGQEISWDWIDLAVNTGLGDYLKTYIRYYEPETPVAGYFYLNTLTQ